MVWAIPIENHEAINNMSLGFARDVMRVHEGCPVSICGKKRQAIKLLNDAQRAAQEAAAARHLR